MMSIQRTRDASGKRRNQKALALVTDDRNTAGARGVFVLRNRLERAAERANAPAYRVRDRPEPRPPK